MDLYPGGQVFSENPCMSVPPLTASLGVRTERPMAANSFFQEHFYVFFMNDKTLFNKTMKVAAMASLLVVKVFNALLCKDLTTSGESCCSNFHGLVEQSHHGLYKEDSMPV